MITLTLMAVDKGGGGKTLIHQRWIKCTFFFEDFPKFLSFFHFTSDFLENTVFFDHPVPQAYQENPLDISLDTFPIFVFDSP